MVRSRQRGGEEKKNQNDEKSGRFVLQSAPRSAKYKKKMEELL